MPKMVKHPSGAILFKMTPQEREAHELKINLQKEYEEIKKMKAELSKELDEVKRLMKKLKKES